MPAPRSSTGANTTIVVVNDDLDRAFGEVRSIVTGERLRRDRRPGLFDFVSGLLDEKV